MALVSSGREDGRDLESAWQALQQKMKNTGGTERHENLQEQTVMGRRSIRYYRHATTRWGAALESFSPMWFAICISSGGLAAILNAPFVYPARWLRTISTILYVFELVLFIIFTSIMLARWYIYPQVAVRRAANNANELGAYAVPPIALLTLSALTATEVSTTGWGGYDFSVVAYVMWSIGVFWTFATAVTVSTVLFYTRSQDGKTLTPVLFMAPVGLATAGVEAATICLRGVGMKANLIGPAMVVAYFATGIAMFMALLLYPIFFHRLLVSGWPPAAARPGIFIVIGACGQLSTGFQMLGQAAASYSGHYLPSAHHAPSIGGFWTAQTGQGLQTAGTLLALLWLGFGYIWFVFVIIGVVDVFVKRQATYSLGWWALVFPTVTINTAWLELSRSMDSPAFRVLTAMLTTAIAIVYIINLVFTVKGTLNGSLVFAESQLSVEDEIMRTAQGQRKQSA